MHSLSRSAGEGTKHSLPCYYGRRVGSALPNQPFAIGRVGWVLPNRPFAIGGLGWGFYLTS
jgi:hypothetical protein